ncbi:glycosyltransferase family 39 protein [Candidatus Peregrinibacteria bacterium]|nr:glycosyltransferase family 39 protein [Candidatus Peregrinibacteria bacterium]
MALAWMALAEISPEYSSVFYRQGGGAMREGTLPLSVDSSGAAIDVGFMLTLNELHPRIYRVVPDNCLESLAINGQAVDLPDLPFCDYTEGRHLDLGPWLHVGNNVIAARIRDDGGRGGMRIDVSPRDQLMILLALFIAGTALCFVGVVSGEWSGRLRFHRMIFAVLVLGIALRATYLFAVPYWVHVNDVDGHIEYVRYILAHWRAPPIHGGWEFYQPPLYYILTAAVVKVFAFVAPLRDTDAMQATSFAFSCLTLAALLGIAHAAFPKRARRTDAALFLFLCATFPILVFSAGRINNDGLVVMLGSFALLFLVRFVGKGRSKDWCAAAALIVAGLLAKTNAALLLVPLFCAPLLLKRYRYRHAALLLCAGSGMLLLAYGWFLIPRMLEEENARSILVGNIGNLTGALSVGNAPSFYYVFHPLAVLRNPYNNAWDDASGRQYFLEYLFRSAFTGEFDLGAALKPLVQMILLVWMAIAAVGILGMGALLRRCDRMAILFLITGCSLLLGHAAFRFLSPYGPSQDFRYNMLLLVPSLFFVLRGRQAFRGFARDAVTSLLVLAGILNAILVLCLCVR